MLLLSLTGCSSMTSLVNAAAKDPASVNIRVTTIYGTLLYQRWTTNTPPSSGF
jgi:hypothetical protein